MRWLLACLLPGCQVVFPLDAVRPEGHTCQGIGDTFSLDLIADTYVDGTDTSHGHEGALVLSSTDNALLRWAIGPNRFEDLHFTVRLEGAMHSDACGAGCGACPPSVNAGEHIFFTRSDWDESAATTVHRTATAPWALPGPGGADVIELLHGKSTAQDRSLTIEFDGVPADPSWPTGQISMMFQLPNLSDTPKTVVGSRDEACETVQPPTATATCLPRVLCGDGVVELFAGENCDDGNRESGDGCNEFCVDEALCGNGTIDPGEVCDDGNTNETDGCTSECQVP